MPHAMPELAAELRLACMRLVRRVRYNTATLAPHFFSVLAYLDRRESATAAELAGWERVSAPSMSRTVGELADRGLISRTPDAADKRRVNLQITDEGRALLQAGRRERDQWMVERLQACSAEERECLRHAADIINRIVRDS